MEKMFRDGNDYELDKCSRTVEYIRMRNKHQLESLLRVFYQEPNRRGNLNENKFTFFRSRINKD